MTPSARYAAAAELLDEIARGRPAEQALTNWARRNRYAGSGDRAALRDIVFDAVRRWRSSAVRGGGETGRARILGLLREAGTDPESVFAGQRYALSPLTAAERDAGALPSGAAALDMPDWILPLLEASLGGDLGPVCDALRRRAETFLRWNLSRTDADTVTALLAEDGVQTEPHPLAPQALRVVSGARRIRQAQAYRDGLVELQDAASQAVCAALPVHKGLRVLDFCAGGGGKALAMADRGAEVFAHDKDAHRMTDLPVRAARAGVDVRVLSAAQIAALAPFDIVLADVPCSGSGAWRRQADAKWRLTPERLSALTITQHEILTEAAAYVADGGTLAYATCSLLTVENGEIVQAFADHQTRSGAAPWSQTRTLSLSPLLGGDGFFLALLQKPDQP